MIILWAETPDTDQRPKHEEVAFLAQLPCNDHRVNYLEKLPRVLLPLRLNYRKCGERHHPWRSLTQHHSIYSEVC